MPCTNHPDVLTGLETCAGCGKPFCGDCIVQIRGESVCADCKQERVKDIRSGVSDDGFELAGRGRRLGGSMIDTVAILAVVFAIYFAMGYSDKPGDIRPPQAIRILISIAIAIIYEGVLLSWQGKTLGKMALGMRVVAVSGGEIGAGRAWGRAFARGLMAGTQILGLVDNLMIFSASRATLHDRLVKTRVVVDA